MLRTQSKCHHAMTTSRRGFMLGSAAWSGLALLSAIEASPALADEAGEPFSPDYVARLAEELAKSDYAKPTLQLPEPFNALSDAQYRDIRFRPEQAIWRGEGRDYELALLPLGWIYDVPVDIWVVEDGMARRLKADSTLFSLGALADRAPAEAPYGFSGLMINGPLNRADVLDAFVQFQGASYFKAIGRGEHYGLSARGLAVNTARPGGEEFPIFRAFWVERPQPGSSEIVVHVLLDSQSTTGAYRFAVSPGATTVMDVDAVLFPRKELTHVGLAPLTSMFLYGSAQRRMRSDYRPAVHNSEGLAVLNGMGERLWRPLTNPAMLQTSAFVDKNPKGFGLAQRRRDFAAFEDLEARFDRRPTAWVEPKGDWGEGYVELIEIPTDDEIHDNIVVYWKPAKGPAPAAPFRFAYRLSWSDDIPVAWSGASVVKTRMGAGHDGNRAVFAIDFNGPALAGEAELPAAELGTSAGTISNLIVERNPVIEGVRVRFELDPAGTDLIELRLGLKAGGRLISESWLYRWTKA